MRQTAAKYGKMAYSAQFGFSVVTGQWGISTAGVDSTLSLCEDDWETWKLPRIVEDVSVSDAGVITSTWKPWADVSARTWLFPPAKGKPYHTRVHRIKTARKLHFSTAGFSINSETGPEGNARHTPVLKTAKEVAAAHGRWSSAAAALATSDSGVTGVIDLLPGEEGKKVDIITSDPSANLIFPRSVFPTLLGSIDAGEEKWVAVRIFATPSLRSEEWLREWEGLRAWSSVEEMKRELGVE